MPHRTHRTTITRSADCSTSPRDLLVEQLAIALATGNAEVAGPLVTEDIEWVIIGGRMIVGKEALTKLLGRTEAGAVTSVSLHHVVSHGKAGAVNGTIVLAKGRPREFCDVYDFATAKGSVIRRITSYDIPT